MCQSDRQEKADYDAYHKCCYAYGCRREQNGDFFGCGETRIADVEGHKCFQLVP